MRTTLTAVFVLTLWVGTVNAATVDADFDSLSAGAVTAATLDGATTGGSWTLPSYSNSGKTLVHVIENDGGAAGEKALSSKIGGGGGHNPPLLITSELDFTTAIDSDVTGAEISFEVAQQKGTGFGRYVRYSFLDSSNTEVFYFHVNNDLLNVNGTAITGSLIGDPNGGLATWNSDASSALWTATVSIDTAGNVNWTFAGKGGSTTIASTSEIKKFRSNMEPDQWQGQGNYLNYFTATTTSTIPTPAALPAGLTLIVALAARRKPRT